MLRPFSDSRQLPRFIHPNISSYVSSLLAMRLLEMFLLALCERIEGGG
jgi:hypothetical protein